MNDKQSVISERQVEYKIKVFDNESKIDYVELDGVRKINTGTDAEDFTAVFCIDRNDIYFIEIADRAGNKIAHSVEISGIKYPRPFSSAEILERCYLFAIKPTPSRIVRGSSLWEENSLSDVNASVYKLKDIDGITVPHYCGDGSNKEKTTNDIRLFTASDCEAVNFNEPIPPSANFDWSEIILDNVNMLPVTLDYLFFFKRNDGSFIPLKDVAEFSFDVTGELEIEKSLYIDSYTLFPTSESGNNGDGELIIRFKSSGLEVKRIVINNSNETDISKLVPEPPSIHFDLSFDLKSAKVYIEGSDKSNQLNYKSYDGTWQVYTEPFTVDDGTVTIYAKETNKHGDSPESMTTINLFSEPNSDPYVSYPGPYPNEANGFSLRLDTISNATSNIIWCGLSRPAKVFLYMGNDSNPKDKDETTGWNMVYDFDEAYLNKKGGSLEFPVSINKTRSGSMHFIFEDVYGKLTRLSMDY